jgi:hypothetical protein
MNVMLARARLFKPSATARLQLSHSELSAEGWLGMVDACHPPEPGCGSPSARMSGDGAWLGDAALRDRRADANEFLGAIPDPSVLPTEKLAAAEQAAARLGRALLHQRR